MRFGADWRGFCGEILRLEGPFAETNKPARRQTVEFAGHLLN
jgi:hypothetical protein